MTTPRSRVLPALLSLALLQPACPRPVPPSDGGPVAQPTRWTDTAHTVLDILHWTLPAAKFAVGLLPLTPIARAEVQRVLDTLVTTSVPGLEDAVRTYEVRGGNDATSRCQAYAASGATTTALLTVARTLAEQGFALGTDLEQVLTGLGALADDLAPACDRDAGWVSESRTTRTALAALASNAQQRGQTLRPLVLVRRDAGAP